LIALSALSEFAARLVSSLGSATLLHANHGREEGKRCNKDRAAQGTPNWPRIALNAEIPFKARANPRDSAKNETGQSRKKTPEHTILDQW